MHRAASPSRPRRDGNQVVLAGARYRPGRSPRNSCRSSSPRSSPPRIRAKGPGSGCRSAMASSESHGGKLTYAPRPGGGAEFTVTLPFAAVSGRTECPVARPATEGVQGAVDPGGRCRSGAAPSGERSVRHGRPPGGQRAHRRRGDAAGEEENSTWSWRIPERLAEGGASSTRSRRGPHGESRVMITVPDDGSAGRLQSEGFRVVERPITVRQLKEAAGERRKAWQMADGQMGRLGRWADGQMGSATVSSGGVVSNRETPSPVTDHGIGAQVTCAVWANRTTTISRLPPPPFPSSHRPSAHLPSAHR